MLGSHGLRLWQRSGTRRVRGARVAIRSRALASVLVPSLLLAAAGSVDAAVGAARPATSTDPAAANWLEGIDVSHWQGTIDWSQVYAAGKRFAIIKATESTNFIDSQYATNRAAAKAAGLLTTGYHFARPSTDPNDAVNEADWFVDHLGLTAGDLPPALDLEVSGGLGVTALQNWVLAWVTEVYGRLGVRPMIYTSPSFWRTYLGDTSMFADAGYAILWVAHWGVSNPTVPGNNWGGKSWTFWQYTSDGSVPGISDRVDLDRYNGLDLAPLVYAPNFALSLTPASGSVRQGSGLSFDVSVDRTSFVSSLTFSASGLPAGASSSFSPNPVSGGSTSVTLTTSKTGTITPMGTFPVTIRASGGGLTRSVSFSLTVTDGIFVSRQSGTTRYATAATVATKAFSGPVPVAYIVTGANFPDGLAAAAAGAHLGGPVLLVDSVHNQVPAETASALRTLRPGRIVVVGGSSVVSGSIVSQLASIVGSGTPISRVAGADRYATAAAVATSQFSGPVPVAYVATGRTYPDALAGSAPAGQQGGPVLLVDGLRTTLPTAIRSALGKLAPRRIVVLGGTSVVSSALATQLAAYTTGGVSRLSGADRYATAASIATREFAAGVPVAYVATGDNFPDALGAGAASGARDGPVLLVHSGTNAMPSATQSALTALRPRSIVVVGGTSVVSSSIQTQLAGYVVN